MWRSEEEMLDRVRVRADQLRRRRRTISGMAFSGAVASVAAGVVLGLLASGTTSLPTAILQADSFVPHSVGSGGGDQTGSAFTVPDDVAGWIIRWSYACGDGAATGPGTGNFYISVERVGHREHRPTLRGLAAIGGEGAGVLRYTSHGRFRLRITSECSWRYTVSTT